nr:MAG TPA: hypothetical protein [Caudoviricetes sp.]
MRELRFKPKRFEYVHAYYKDGTLYKMTEQLYPESEVVWVKGLGLDYWSCIKFKSFDEFFKWKQEEDRCNKRIENENLRVSLLKNAKDLAGSNIELLERLKYA